MKEKKERKMEKGNTDINEGERRDEWKKIW